MKYLSKTVASLAIATTAALGGTSTSEAAVSLSNVKTVGKVGYDLTWLYEDYLSKFPIQETQPPTLLQPPGSPMRAYGDRVLIDAVASGETNILLNDLLDLGLQTSSQFGRHVSGLIPIQAIPLMNTLSSLQFAKPTRSFGEVGLVTSEADIAMRADLARTRFGVDGSGITVGVLSDSFNFLGGAATDVATGDLPPDVTVLQDLPADDPFGGMDEGRAMMQLIYDIAPGVDLAFHTAVLGQASFAQGIINLAEVAGADVIVDDIAVLDEPFFQDGIIAQAVDQVFAKGVSYFSAAGNNARDSYESPFRRSGEFLFGSELHDFDPGSGIDPFQSITVPEGSKFTLSFQWDSPFFSVDGGAGSPNDLDILLLDSSGTNILALSAAPNVGGDPVEIFRFFNDGSFGTDQFNLAIPIFEGPDAGYLKYIIFGAGDIAINEFDTASGTSFGHSNAVGAEAVGAAFYLETPAFGTNPPLLQPFSSAGPVPILFDIEGNRLPEPEIRLKPEIVAPDGTNTTFFPLVPGADVEGDGFPNFFGTSAAAPHAAAVAALMLEAAPGSSPRDIYTALENTAIDMDDPSTPGFDVGFDFGTGYGLIQADQAIAALVEPEPIPEPAPMIGLLFTSLWGASRELKRQQKAKQLQKRIYSNREVG